MRTFHSFFCHLIKNMAGIAPGGGPPPPATPYVRNPNIPAEYDTPEAQLLIAEVDVHSFNEPSSQFMSEPIVEIDFPRDSDGNCLGRGCGDCASCFGEKEAPFDRMDVDADSRSQISQAQTLLTDEEIADFEAPSTQVVRGPSQTSLPTQDSLDVASMRDAQHGMPMDPPLSRSRPTYKFSHTLSKAQRETLEKANFRTDRKPQAPLSQTTLDKHSVNSKLVNPDPPRKSHGKTLPTTSSPPRGDSSDSSPPRKPRKSSSTIPAAPLKKRSASKRRVVQSGLNPQLFRQHLHMIRSRDRTARLTALRTALDIMRLDVKHSNTSVTGTTTRDSWTRETSHTTQCIQEAMDAIDLELLIPFVLEPSESSDVSMDSS